MVCTALVVARVVSSTAWITCRAFGWSAAPLRRHAAARYRPTLRVADPHVAAAGLIAETRDRIRAVLDQHPEQPAVLLSGGVDSIFVAATAVALGARPHAITIVTDNSTDEANAVVAAHVLGLTHDVVRLSAPMWCSLREMLSRDLAGSRARTVAPQPDPRSTTLPMTGYWDTRRRNPAPQPTVDTCQHPHAPPSRWGPGAHRPTLCRRRGRR